MQLLGIPNRSCQISPKVVILRMKNLVNFRNNDIKKVALNANKLYPSHKKGYFLS